MTLRYTTTAIALHWLLALLIAAAVVLGATMTSLPLSPTRLRLFNVHKWLGVTILALSALRLAWRLGHAPPPTLPGPAWQQATARWTQRALYALFLAVPLAGWAYSSAAGFPVVWLGVLPLPDLAPVDRGLASVLKSAHGTLAWTLAALAALHVAAALKHRFVDGDGLLDRMRPSR